MAESRDLARARPAPNTEVRKQRTPGISVRHGRLCEERTGGACSCTTNFQAQAWSANDRKPLRRTFKTVGEAWRWRQEAQAAIRRGKLHAPSQRTVPVTADDS